MKIFLFIFVSMSHFCGGEANYMKGFLLYEDQNPNICNSQSCWNALTLKRKMYEEEKSMKDFTLCYRMNLLSYTGKGKQQHLFRSKTDKWVLNAGTDQKWTTGFHHDLNPVDAHTGLITIQTFNERIDEVILSNGIYTIFPQYQTELMANQWNSFCIGSSLQGKYIFLARNGMTVQNTSQPQLWADLNVGLDTSILQPFQVT